MDNFWLIWIRFYRAAVVLALILIAVSLRPAEVRVKKRRYYDEDGNYIRDGEDEDDRPRKKRKRRRDEDEEDDENEEEEERPRKRRRGEE